jgi:transaldolase
MVKIPATSEGVRAIETMISEGHSINVTLLFSLARYAEVLEAYLAGLEKSASRGGDVSMVHSVASFFVSRVDVEVDGRLEKSEALQGTTEAHSLRGQTGVAQAKLAYQLFRNAHTGPRWDALAERGARVQRPLWASTSTKNPLYPDTLYVDNLIGPETVNTLSEETIRAFEDHGHLARTVDDDVADAEVVVEVLAGAGIDLDDVGRTLEAQGIDGFRASYTHVLDALRAETKTFSGG